jgi:diguanylate cyclase (GGDEF)-like protein
VDAVTTGDRDDRLAAAVQAIWARRRPEVLVRVDVVEAAVAALLAGHLPDELRDQARREAHKLAGSAGTFGFPRASALARELELALEAEAPQLSGAGRMAEQVLELRGQLIGPVATEGTGPDARERPLVLIVGADRARTRELAAEAAVRGMRTRVVEVGDAVTAAATYEPSAVLLDAGSDPDGATFHVIRLLADAEVPAHRLAAPAPVLVLGGAGTLADRVEVARAGARRVLPASLPAQRVLEAVLQVLAQARQARPTVVALDDDPAILEALDTVLGRAGISVSAMEDPDAFWQRIHGDPPELVILDVDMPDADGVEVCRAIRNDAELAGVPVLFLTARADADTLQRIFAAGADDFVHKPLVPAVLLTRVRNRLDRIRLLRELAERDQLTGLSNRLFAEKTLDRMLETAHESGDPLSLAVIDVDRFKLVNDRFGHAAGDRVLRGVADLLRVSFREEDIVGRWGGEEFVVGMYGVSTGMAAARVEQALERLREEGLPWAGEAGRGVRFSAGVAELGAHGEDLEQVYRAADEALYRAKSAGRDRVVAAGDGSCQETERVDVAVIDDDETLTDLLLHSLQTAGLTARAISDGAETRRLLTGDDPALIARVLLVDVDLPGLDGLALLRELGSAGVLRRSRAIMLTARAAEAETLLALELGAVDHIAKPFSVPVLMQRIRRALDG